MTQEHLGSRPGTLNLPEGSPSPRIHVMQYAADRLEELDDVAPAQLRELVDPSLMTWIDVQGLGDPETLLEIARLFDLHPIELENAVNMPQRAKSEIYGAHHLMVARVPIEVDGQIGTPPQVSIVAGESFVLTFQERYLGLFDGVRARIRAGNQRITSLGAGYLCYALLDSVVDHYFPVVDRINTDIERLEDNILTDLRPEMLGQLHALRRSIAVIRRVGTPQREALTAMLDRPSPVITDEIHEYLRDAIDHIAQVLGRLDSAKDAAASLADLYLSEVSFKTNEIMKLLTLMASIFIPLTFIAGVYGMNFESMPELRNPIAYPTVLGVMLLVAILMLVYFRRRGWIGSPPRSRKD